MGRDVELPRNEFGDVQRRASGRLLDLFAAAKAVGKDAAPARHPA